MSEKYHRARIFVYCKKCGSRAPYFMNAQTGMTEFLWHEPCPKCGAEEWAAGDSEFCPDIVMEIRKGWINSLD